MEGKVSLRSIRTTIKTGVSTTRGLPQMSPIILPKTGRGILRDLAIITMSSRTLGTTTQQTFHIFKANNRMKTDGSKEVRFMSTRVTASYQAKKVRNLFLWGSHWWWQATWKTITRVSSHFLRTHPKSYSYKVPMWRRRIKSSYSSKRGTLIIKILLRKLVQASKNIFWNRLRNIEGRFMNERKKSNIFDQFLPENGVFLVND